ncbi:hypothetical protein TNCV_2240521 [Trichonephila clavipes]|nr:hypothetical protein TNCV_2240521 [Trichonephila clavipes]
MLKGINIHPLQDSQRRELHLVRNNGAAVAQWLRYPTMAVTAFFKEKMETENFDTSSDTSDPRIEWRSIIQNVLEKIEHCKVIFNAKERLFSLAKLDLNLFFFQDSLSEESEVQNQNRDSSIQETIRSVSEVNFLMESTKKAHNLAEDRLESITSHISQHDGQTQVRETNDLIKRFETMSSQLCEVTNKFEEAVTRIEEKVRALTKTNGATNL